MAKKKNEELERQITESNDEAFSQLRVALGAKSRDEVIKLVRTDPEARRLALKILGTNSPLGLEGAQHPGTPARPKGSARKKVVF